MRWLPALALVCSLAACRRSPPDPDASAATAATSGSVAEPAAEPPRADAPAEAGPIAAEPAASPAPASPPATAPPAPPSPQTERLPDASLPPPPAAPSPGPEQKHDDRIYAWVDEQGVIHYGGVDDIPPAQRKEARVVDAGVTVVSPEPSDPVARPEAAPTPAPARTGEQPAARRPDRQRPELDDKGLPIPGTMDDTAATRASKAAGEIQIDPAAVERRRQEELRRMNCKERDGAFFCD